MNTTTRTYPAQIVFFEVENVLGPRRWRGRLLRPSSCIDIETGRPVRCVPIFNIEEDPQTGRCAVTIQGGDRGGRRYTSHPNVTLAQKAGIRWAGRRFRVEAP